jgi:chaperonin cofactor prefoldin
MTEEKNKEELQKIVQELQIIRGQIQTLSSQSSEYSLTIESLKLQSPENTVYKSVGNLLLEINNREELLEELSLSKVNIENHIKLLIEREESLREEYDKLVTIFESK